MPVDQNLTWKECRFNIFDYGGKAPQPTTAARIIYANDDGQEYTQQYSVGDTARFLPSQDGKTLIAVGTAAALSKSSNFYILMNALINAGFPENRLPENGDISVLDGLYTYNIGLPEPKRAGLVRQAQEGAREKVLSVPSQILKLPWEKKAAGRAPARGKAMVVKEAEDEGGEDIGGLALDFVSKQLEKSDDGKVTRQELAVAVFKDLAKDPNRDAIATYIFGAEMQAKLVAGGYRVDGESIGK